MQLEKNKIIIGVVAAVVIVGIWMFSSGLSDAPKKTISEIEKAVKNHDVGAFEKYVDLQNFFSEGFDSYVSAHMNEEVGTMNAADAGFISMFKSAIVGDLISVTKETIKKGDTLAQSAHNKMGGVAEEFGIAAWELKRVGSSKKRGKAAIVPVTVRDHQVEKDFVFDIELRKTDDGIWRVQKVANAEDLILTRVIAAKSRLDEVNAGIVKELADAVSISSEKVEAVVEDGGFFASQKAIITFLAKNNQEKDIVGLSALITVYDKNGEAIYTHTAAWPTLKTKLGAGEQRELLAKDYLYGQDYELLSKNENQGGNIEIVISQVKYSDGVEVHKLRNLPPYEK